MVVAGIPSVARLTRVECYLERVGGPRQPQRGSEPGAAPTRSALAIEIAAAEAPDGAIWVVGNAPTALRRILQLHGENRLRPRAVIGLPVGYVGAADAKEQLWESDLRDISITNRGRRGGSPVAAACLNALARLALTESG